MLIGAVMYGDTADGAWFFAKIKAKEDIAAGPRHADLRPRLRRGDRAGPYGGRCSLAG